MPTCPIRVCPGCPAAPQSDPPSRQAATLATSNATVGHVTNDSRTGDPSSSLRLARIVLPSTPRPDLVRNHCHPSADRYIRSMCSDPESLEHQSFLALTTIVREHLTIVDASRSWTLPHPGNVDYPIFANNISSYSRVISSGPISRTVLLTIRRPLCFAAETPGGQCSACSSESYYGRSGVEDEVTSSRPDGGARKLAACAGEETCGGCG